MQKKIIIGLVVLMCLPILTIATITGISNLSSILSKESILAILLILIGIPILWVSLIIIRKNYIPLSSDSKSSFWQILTNIFLVYFTFWMGIYVQDLIASKNEAVNKKLVSFEYVDRIKPHWNKVNISNELIADAGIFTDRIEILRDKYKLDSIKSISNKSYSDSCKLDLKELNRYQNRYYRYIIDKRGDLIRLSKIHDSIMADYKYYVNQTMFDSISNVNRIRNILIGVAELIDNSSLLDSVSPGIIATSLEMNDTLAAFKELSYFENLFKSPYMFYSGNPSRDYQYMAELGSQMYHMALGNDEGKYSIYNKLLTYLMLDGKIMMEEMSTQRLSSPDRIMTYIKDLLGSPVRTFLVFLILTFIVSAIITRVISPRNIKALVEKDKYDTLEKEYKEVNEKVRHIERELNRKREECKEAEIKIKNLEQKINSEIGKSIVD